ncbi:MAG: endo-arabinase [Bacteroidota bacterium]|nr:endo-arabinase [Bacteroidota bacterium]
MKIVSVLIMAILLCFKQPANDEVLIKKLLEKESATWRNGDIKAHAACWYIRPYSRILVSTADSHTYDVPPENMINPKQMGNGGTSKNSNYTFSIHGNDAWVSHDEVSVSAKGDTTYSYEIRILEKINGEWKLVGQSIHIHK